MFGNRSQGKSVFGQSQGEVPAEGRRRGLSDQIITEAAARRAYSNREERLMPFLNKNGPYKGLNMCFAFKAQAEKNNTGSLKGEVI